MKTCNVCKIEKPLTDFSKRKDTDGYKHACKQCLSKKALDRYHLNGGKEKQAKRAYKSILKKYGLSVEDYEKLLILQNSKCKICGSTSGQKEGSRLFVDHCHSTGKVRGLLCHNCNAGLGHFKDSTDLLNKAMSYLNENRN